MSVFPDPRVWERSPRRARWVGPLHLTTSWSPVRPWLVEGCGCTVVEVDNETGEMVSTRFAKGYAIRYSGNSAVVIAVRCKYAGCPMAPSTWLRSKRYWLLWVLRGGPVVAPQRAGREYQAAAVDTPERATNFRVRP